MANKIDQKAYLQKYLSGASSTEKKKKKKKSTKGKGFKIIDDDIDLSKLRALEGDELDFMNDEDAPVIAGIIDERPEEIRKLEQFKTSSKWRVINQDDGFNSKLQIEEIKKDIVEQQKENELIFGKMYSDSEDESQNTIIHLKQTQKQKINEKSSKKQQNSDSDFSPPRKSHNDRPPPKKKSRNYDSDQSPPRKHKNKEQERNYDSDVSPPRKSRKDAPSRSIQKQSDSDQSRPSKHSNKKHRNNDNDSDISPPRKQSRQSPSKQRSDSKYDSDVSPPRRSDRKEWQETKERRKPSRWGQADESGSNYASSSVNGRQKSRNESPVRSRSPRNSYYDDSRRNRTSPKRYNKSPSRHRNAEKYSGNKYQNNRHKSPDSDLSPPRKTPAKKDSRRIRSPESDISPPRKREQSSRSDNRQKKPSDSDISPPRTNLKRNHNSDSDMSPPRKNNTQYNDSPPPSNKKMAKTLEGKKAGLQDARDLRQENEAFRRREDEAFKKLGDDVSGRNAHAVSRKAKRETSEERRKLQEKAERQKELDEKYKRWTKGVKQIEVQEARVQEYLHEASKPLARHRDDKDLEDNLRNIERDGDPMLEYIREKKRERGELGPAKPMYKGSFPPNRFNIRPGYRWDGVDRSNGYEKKYFEQHSKRKAMEEEAYKWSTEDL